MIKGQYAVVYDEQTERLHIRMIEYILSYNMASICTKSCVADKKLLALLDTYEEAEEYKDQIADVIRTARDNTAKGIAALDTIEDFENYYQHLVDELKKECEVNKDDYCSYGQTRDAE